MSQEPLLTSVVGSHARPSWFVSGIDAAERGEFGPADLEEMLDDAVDLALRDQEEAGVDIVSDGEMRRAGFFTAEFYRHLTGVRALPPDRRLGAGAHDQQHRFEVLEPIAAPDGLGVVAEYRYAVTRATRPLKVTLPGPYTLSGRLTYGPGQVYATRNAAAEAFVPILRAELDGLVAAGADFIQIDEPSPAIHPEAPADFSALFNAAVAARRRTRPARGAPLLRQLPRPAARPADVPARPRRDARLPGRRAGARVRQPGDGRGRDPRRDRRRRPPRRRRRHRRQELVRRDGGRRRRADRRGARGRRPGRRASRSSRTAASARPPRGQTRAKLTALVAGRDLVLGRTHEEEDR